ncbi:MAG: hypothetical protein KF862_27170 [Chitinophagaceae bacterium]|nr:hypothetical protein [Chitinophagaceae bacterium]
MKKGQAKNNKSSKVRALRSVKRAASTKKNTSFVAKGVNSTNYAKVISYIVKAEENETNLMIASASI